MKIIGLKAEQFMKLVAVNIELTDNGVFVIGGENDVGKTAVLKLVRAIVGGQRELPAVPVRLGETKALGELTIGDGKAVLVATLTMTSEGGYALKVKSKDGATYSKPATMLADLISAVTFNPLSLLDMTPKEQRDLFFKLAKLDFSALDGQRQTLSDGRAAMGRDVAGRKRAIDAMPQYPDAPKKEIVPPQAVAELIDISELSAKLEETNKHNMEQDSIGISRTNKQDAIGRCDDEIAKSKAQIAIHKANIEKMTALKDGHEKAIAALPAQAYIDAEPLRESIRTAKTENDKAVQDAAAKNRESAQSAAAINAKVRANASRSEVQKRFDADKAEYDAISAKIKAIDEQKQKALSEAQFPVDGLEFPPEGGVNYKGLPLAQDSGSGQIIRAVEIAAAMNPKLRTLLVDDGERLGPQRLLALDEWARTNDYQILMARVSTGPECAIIIEDGVVKAQT